MSPAPVQKPEVFLSMKNLQVRDQPRLPTDKTMHLKNHSSDVYLNQAENVVNLEQADDVMLMREIMNVHYLVHQT